MPNRPILQTGDEVEIVAPSYSLDLISDDVQEVANRRLEEIGLSLRFGTHVKEMDGELSSSIESRVADLHAAFANPSIRAIFSVIGGYNSNQLLPHLDWELIRQNPKPLIGYSDTTALQNAIFTKTRGISYSGPAYSTFGQKLHFDYTLKYFKSMVMHDAPVDIKPSDSWSDDQWYLDQDKRTLYENKGWLTLQNGTATGTIIGGNLGTFSLLFGTEFMPSLEGTILFLEEDDVENFSQIDRLFESLVQQRGFSGVQGIVLGRFQLKSEITPQKLQALVSKRSQIAHLPIIANVDFGHTSPLITYPIGGIAEIYAENQESRIVIQNS